MTGRVADGAWWRDPVAWWSGLGRPLRMLPRWGALAVTFFMVGALIWSGHAVADFQRFQDQRRAERAEQPETSFGDVELYARINRRVQAGEGYYDAALAEHRAHAYPTRPFVTVRTPVAAWGARLFGEAGWRIFAVAVLIGTVLAWIGALPGTVSFAERAGIALLLFGGGVGAFYERVGLVHELLAGLCLSLALGLYRKERWWPGLLAAAAALAIRELAAPFILLWAAFAVSGRRWRELAAIGMLLTVFAIAMALHAYGVAGARLPGDQSTPGWSGMLGLPMVLTSMVELSPLMLLLPWLGGPVALLALLGWIGIGGRLGLFATMWFVGMGAAIALFARAENFYWVLLLQPAFLGGLALVPRALGDLAMAVAGDRQGRR